MCGITGIFAFADQQKTWPQGDVESMLIRLAHRGPDDRGMHVEPGLFLGHTRLAVLDLSAAGHQPMFTPDKRYVVSYNGEIYNFRELRKELSQYGHRFRTESDTEVLLAAWQEWGASTLDKVDGIFAFALFDRDKKTLFLVRDHLGIKPLFYAIQHDQVIFASELLALLGPLNPSLEVSEEDIDTYFTFNYLPAPRTGLKGVHQIPPGSMVTVNAYGGTVQRYWKPQYQKNPAPWSHKTRDRFEELLASSVKRQLVSDAPLGLFLSGGLDSFAIALSTVEAGQHPTAFTLGFDDAKFNEAPDAVQYARYLGITSETFTFRWNESEIYETLGAMRELLADASCFPIYQLSRFARKKVTVALAGDGGDELLAGYDTYRAGEITPYLRMCPCPLKKMLRGAARYLPSDNSRYGMRMVVERLLDAAEEGYGRDHASFRRITGPGMKKRIYSFDFYDKTIQQDPVGEYANLMNEVPEERSYLTARQHADLMFHLPSILAKVDRMSMANGLEVRVPLLSREMVEFCLDLPDDAKRFRGKGKRILRKAIAGKAPVGALTRRKAGFLPPVDQWFRSSGPMNNVFGDHLSKAKSSLGFLNWREVEKVWVEHRCHRIEAGFMLLGILQFMNWSQQCKSST